MRINVKCNFCGSTFDEVGNNGICPSCGARNNKNKIQKKSSIEQKNMLMQEKRRDYYKIFPRKDLKKTLIISVILSFLAPVMFELFLKITTLFY